VSLRVGTAQVVKSRAALGAFFSPVATVIDCTTSRCMASSVLQSLREQLQALRSAPRICHVCQEPLSGMRRVTCAPCFDQGKHRARYKGLYKGSYRRTKSPREKTCPRCEAVFTPHNNAQRYCTRICGVKAYSESRSLLRGEPCQHCGRAIEGRPRKFCDAACRRRRFYKLHEAKGMNV
jgi:hypothetical protein